MAGLYKVVTRLPLSDDVARLVRAGYGLTPFQPTLGVSGSTIPVSLGSVLREAVERTIAEIRQEVLTDARAELDQQGRGHHLLNLYLGLDQERGDLICTWTFGNRDTALLFKLSRE